jgi:hypothetical protein
MDSPSQSSAHIFSIENHPPKSQNLWNFAPLHGALVLPPLTCNLQWIVSQFSYKKREYFHYIRMKRIISRVMYVVKLNRHQVMAKAY